MRTHTWFWAAGIALAFAGACTMDFGAFNISAGGGGAGAGSTTSGGAGGGGECDTAAQCPGQAVCDPLTLTCQDQLACATHLECGGGAYCQGGICAPNSEGGPCDGDVNCVPPEQCVGDVCACGGDVYGADNVPPNMLIVLDRSGSMNDNIGGGTKWEIAQQAISTLVATHGDSVRFGLMLYPGTNQSGSQGADCGPGAVFIDPAPATASAIDSFLAGAGTTGFGTPTAEALDILPGYAGLEDTSRANYVLLITDGQSTCDDPVPSVTALRNEVPEIKTFVVGFGSGVDPNELNDMATAGGTAKAQTPYYYQADDASSLDAAFASIAGSVLSCSYTLSDVPPDPNLLFIYIDGVQVPQDPNHADGWDYDPATNQITFYGSYCDTLQSGGAGSLIISYGCPPPEIN